MTPVTRCLAASPASELPEPALATAVTDCSEILTITAEISVTDVKPASPRLLTAELEMALNAVSLSVAEETRLFLTRVFSGLPAESPVTLALAALAESR